MRFYPGGPQQYYPPDQQSNQVNYFPPLQGYARNDPQPTFVRQQPGPY
jgi:hypothetical protein